MDNIRSEVLWVLPFLFDQPVVIILIQEFEASLCLACLQATIVQNDYKSLCFIVLSEIMIVFLFVYWLLIYFWLNFLEVRDIVTITTAGLVPDSLFKFLFSFVLCFHIAKNGSVKTN